MRIHFLMIFLFSTLFFPLPAQAKLHTEVVEYKDGEVPLKGYLAYDEAVQDKRPAIIIVHDWKGEGPFVRERAEQLAKMGYIAFAIDMYGKGVRPETTEDAATQAGIYKGDRALMQRRARSAYELLRQHPLTDSSRMAAIGYCFGGTTVLEMARAGMDLLGVVSFHGGLSTPNPEKTAGVKAKVLALHGADDPYVPADEVKAFQEEMNKAKVDWQMVFYSHAVHSFTNPQAGNDNSKGAAYNEEAARWSWLAMQDFFKEIF